MREGEGQGAKDMKNGIVFKRENAFLAYVTVRVIDCFFYSYILKNCTDQWWLSTSYPSVDTPVASAGTAICFVQPIFPMTVMLVAVTHFNRTHDCSSITNILLYAI